MDHSLCHTRFQQITIYSRKAKVNITQGEYTIDGITLKLDKTFYIYCKKGDNSWIH